jgi:serine/threonine protein kinase
VGSTRPLAPHKPALALIEPGTRLGAYEVQEFLGQGAMGVVYRAYHAELERAAAVKVLQGIGPDPESNARFRREAQAIAHMRHPNILNVYDFGAYGGTPYMIVEFVAGGSLADRIQQGPIDRRSAIEFIRGIGEALDYAHSLGIVHRDVKPANVLMGPDSSPILADFGLAKLMESSSIKSITGMTTGTPAYMAPEQVTGSEVGPPADRYSLATIAYELLTGVYPFDGEGVLEMLYAHVHREPPAPSSINPRLTPSVDGVILRGLAKAPADRWPSCEAFVEALDTALRAAPVAAIEQVAASPVRPALPSTARIETAVPRLAATAVMALEPPPAAPVQTPTRLEPTVAVVTKKPRRPSRYWLAALLLIPLLALAGYCGYGAVTATTLTLSPSTVHAGDEVKVTAAHVPPSQSGEIQLLSVLHRYAFLSDSNGNVASTLTVPLDTPIGDHTVRNCWNGVCHAQATLHVVGAVALVGPGATPSSTPGTSSSPGAGATPTAQPTGAPKSGSTPPAYHAPSPRPSPLPSPRPSPRPSPTPPPPPPPSISVSPNHVTLLARSITVSGVHFGAGRTVTITVSQGGTSQSFTVTATSQGTFAKGITVPATILAGQATVTACESSTGCASAPITVTLA